MSDKTTATNTSANTTSASTPTMPEPRRSDPSQPVPVPSATSPHNDDSSDEEPDNDPEPPRTSRNKNLSKKEIAAARKRLQELANSPSYLAALNRAMIALTGIDWGLRPDPDPTANRVVPNFDPLTLGEHPSIRKLREIALGSDTFNGAGSGSGSGKRKRGVVGGEAGVAGSAGSEENRAVGGERDGGNEEAFGDKDKQLHGHEVSEEEGK